MNWIVTHWNIVFYIILLLALLLPRIPVIGKFFRGFNTLIHEAGHVLAAIITSGEVMEVNIFSDNSGNTLTKSKKKYAQILIALSGYPISALMGLFFIYLIHNKLYTPVVFIASSIVLLVWVISIRNTYGIIWSFCFLILNILLLYIQHTLYIKIFAVFYALILLCESVVSSFTLVALTNKNSKKAGDASNLAKLTKIPAIIWSLFFLLFSVICSLYAALNFFPRSFVLFTNG